MLKCSSCGSWTPFKQSCPNCALAYDLPTTPWLKQTATAIGGTLVGMTLAACYGSPCATHAGDVRCELYAPANLGIDTCEDALAVQLPCPPGEQEGICTSGGTRCPEPDPVEAPLHET